MAEWSFKALSSLSFVNYLIEIAYLYPSNICIHPIIWSHVAIYLCIYRELGSSASLTIDMYILDVITCLMWNMQVHATGAWRNITLLDACTICCSCSRFRYTAWWPQSTCWCKRYLIIRYFWHNLLTTCEVRPLGRVQGCVSLRVVNVVIVVRTVL